MTTFRVTLTMSILLLVAGFVCPPMGVIDGSVLSAVGMLLAFATLAQVPALIESARQGKTIRLQKGDFSAEVTSPQPAADSAPIAPPVRADPRPHADTPQP